MYQRTKIIGAITLALLLIAGVFAFAQSADTGDNGQKPPFTLGGGYGGCGGGYGGGGCCGGWRR